jgi:hypothetical protein
MYRTSAFLILFTSCLGSSLDGTIKQLCVMHTAIRLLAKDISLFKTAASSDKLALSGISVNALDRLSAAAACA